MTCWLLENTFSSIRLKRDVAWKITLFASVYAYASALSPAASLAPGRMVAPAFQCVTNFLLTTTLSGSMNCTPVVPMPRPRRQSPVGNMSDTRGENATRVFPFP